MVVFSGSFYESTSYGNGGEAESRERIVDGLERVR
jgi:hypothetical protein